MLSRWPRLRFIFSRKSSANYYSQAAGISGTVQGKSYGSQRAASASRAAIDPLTHTYAACAHRVRSPMKALCDFTCHVHSFSYIFHFYIIKLSQSNCNIPTCNKTYIEMPNIYLNKTLQNTDFM